MTGRQWLMGAALAGAAWLAFFTDGPMDAGVVEAVEAKLPAGRSGAADAVRGGGRSARKAVADSEQVLPLRDRGASAPGRAVPAQEEAGGLFAAATWEPPSKPAPVAPPQAPPLPYTYLGKKLESGAWEVYVSAADEVRVLRQNDVVDARYRVDHIQPPSLVLTYLPLNQRQSMSIGNPE